MQAIQARFSNRKQLEETLVWGGLFALIIALILSSSISTITFIQSVVTGILVGGIYSLVALGIVVINKATGIFNFAHGMMMLFGGLVFAEGFEGTPSTGLSILLGVGTCLSMIMVFADNPETSKTSLKKAEPSNNWFIRVIVGSVAAVFAPLWTYLVLSARSPRFWQVLGIGVVTGVVVAYLTQNLEDSILRGAVAALAGSITLGLLVDRLTIRPLLGQPVLASIMMTLAVALMLQGLVSLIWGSQPRALSFFVKESPPTVIPAGTNPDGTIKYQVIASPGVPLPNYKWNPGGILPAELSIPRNLIWGFAIAISCFVAFVLFFQFTSVGLAMRAVAENQVLADSIGLRVRTILSIAWALATTMAMIAAVIQGMGPGVGLSVLVIPPLAFRAFPAVLLGGLESITGALVGGLIIGVVEVLATVLIDSTTGQEFAPFAVLMIVLLIRPDGLFGQRRIDRV